MVRDDRLYAFIIAHTSRSRSRIRRICVHKRWLKVSALLALVVIGAALYGIYGLTQHIRHQNVEQENARLRAENEKQRQQLDNLNHRVEAVEDASRRLAEMSGVNDQQQPVLNSRPITSNSSCVLTKSFCANARLFLRSGLSKAL
jgi:cell division protein FtsB